MAWTYCFDYTTAALLLFLSYCKQRLVSSLILITPPFSLPFCSQCTVFYSTYPFYSLYFFRMLSSPSYRLITNSENLQLSIKNCVLLGDLDRHETTAVTSELCNLSSLGFQTFCHDRTPPSVELEKCSNESSRNIPTSRLLSSSRVFITSYLPYTERCSLLQTESLENKPNDTGSFFPSFLSCSVLVLCPFSFRNAPVMTSAPFKSLTLRHFLLLLFPNPFPATDNLKKFNNA
jgi:hypothetical protein